MNGDEFQAPKPTEEYLGQTEVETPSNQQQENSTESLMPSESELSTQNPENAVVETVAQLGSDSETDVANSHSAEQEISQRIAELQRTETALKEEIANLRSQLSETQATMGKVIQEALSQLEQRKQALQLSIEQLERRQERIRNEMRTTFAGASQDLAIRVQGFKDYLTGSLQDLAAAAEQLQLGSVAKPEPEQPPRREIRETRNTESESLGTPIQFAQQQFQDTTKQIRRLIDQYRTKPDYYGPVWQLRRTFEPVHAERISNWFFTQGGRGALRTMGSRLQNILIASAAISILHKLYGDRVRTLVLTGTPERLGEWRRGLQDCLGIGRPDFAPDGGVVIFETAEAVAQKADRLLKAKQMPFIIIDDSEDQISLALLQFPLWLAFAPDPRTIRNSYDDDY
ncbi:DUF3086 domain-containing protein [Calothrix sp. UHCC 0171]|uniref:DUF3086 domain-containing protein n=1 Tax=Calothrix sp. UHCC 0171 TaxID=3110245 RepID=UPI002B21AFDD|nr:DUF3086 domain-containing protein [Calothrix sp. UHCC 0171]MEA5573167.1 DUF3086 domain-containing protein [Calothrix sp. UHCC 0171]